MFNAFLWSGSRTLIAGALSLDIPVALGLLRRRYPMGIARTTGKQ
jgi:hypothetical protein